MARMKRKPALVPPKKVKLETVQKADDCSIAGPENISKCKTCPRCGSEYATFVEYAKHPCEKILNGMQSCVVQLDERLPLHVKNTGQLLVYECNQCKKVSLHKYFKKQHKFHSARKCNRSIKTLSLLLNINNTYHPTPKINVLDNINTHPPHIHQSASNASPVMDNIKTYAPHIHQSASNASPESCDSTSSALQTSIELNFQKTYNYAKNTDSLGGNDATNKDEFHAPDSSPYAPKENSDPISNTSVSKPSFCSIS